MTDPGDILQTLETRTVHVSLRRDGIILQRMLPVQRQTMQDARDNLAAFNTLAVGTPHPMLLDARHPVTIDADVSNFYSSPENTGSISAMAILIGSRIGRSVGNVLIAVRPQAYPTRMFTSEDDALVWLRKFAPPRTT